MDEQSGMSNRMRKNAPLEMSSKKPGPQAPRFAVKKRKYRDPRFDDRSGSYTSKAFEKNYDFVFDMQKKELETVRQDVRKEQDPEKKTNLKNLLGRMENKAKSQMKKKEHETKKLERNALQKQRIAEGKNPFFLKKGDKSLLEMASKFEELKKSGKFKNYMEKKRKKNAATAAKRFDSS